MTRHEGGCLCGAARYAVSTPPDWVTVCHCTFCQRATGAPYMVEPIFHVAAFSVLNGAPKRYTHVSGGSGKDVYVHFCAECGTKLYLAFERWPDRMGIYSGTFDDPNWFELSPETAKHIFTGKAQRGVLIPPGFPTYPEHAATIDGTPLDPVVLDEVLHVR